MFEVKGKKIASLNVRHKQNQQTDIVEGCPGMWSNDHSLEFCENFCYLGDTAGSREGANDSVVTRIRSGWSKFRDLVPLLASKGLALGAKGRLYSACVLSVILLWKLDLTSWRGWCRQVLDEWCKNG